MAANVSVMSDAICIGKLPGGCNFDKGEGLVECTAGAACSQIIPGYKADGCMPSKEVCNHFLRVADGRWSTSESQVTMGLDCRWSWPEVLKSNGSLNYSSLKVVLNLTDVPYRSSKTIRAIANVTRRQVQVPKFGNVTCDDVSTGIQVVSIVEECDTKVEKRCDKRCYSVCEGSTCRPKCGDVCTDVPCKETCRVHRMQCFCRHMPNGKLLCVCP